MNYSEDIIWIMAIVTPVGVLLHPNSDRKLKKAYFVTFLDIKLSI